MLMTPKFVSSVQISPVFQTHEIPTQKFHYSPSKLKHTFRQSYFKLKDQNTVQKPAPDHVLEGSEWQK